MTSFFQFLVSLIIILNPISALPIYVALFPHESNKHIESHARLIGLYVFIILISALLFGKILLQIIGLDIIYLTIAGGCVIAWIGRGLVTNTAKLVEMSKNSSNQGKSALFVPIVMPMIAGPGSISLIISTPQPFGIFVSIGAIVISVLTIYGIFRFGYQIISTLKPNRIDIFERLVGLLLLGIGIQTIVSNFIVLLK